MLQATTMSMLSKFQTSKKVEEGPTPQLEQPHDPQSPEHPQLEHEQGDMMGIGMSSRNNFVVLVGTSADAWCEIAKEDLCLKDEQRKQRKHLHQDIYTTTLGRPLHTSPHQSARKQPIRKCPRCGVSAWFVRSFSVEPRALSVGLAGWIDWPECRIFDSVFSRLGLHDMEQAMWWPKSVIDLLMSDTADAFILGLLPSSPATPQKAWMPHPPVHHRQVPILTTTLQMSQNAQLVASTP